MPGEPEHHTPDRNMDEKSVQVSGQVSSFVGSGASEPTDPGRHQLGPHVVGQRVVVRRLVPGATGPTGGPAFTDTLGICVSWDVTERTCVLQPAEGGSISIGFDLIVSGKPVPPRPSIRLRVSVSEAEAQVAQLWDTESLDLGGWTLRTTPPGPDGRTRKRGNSLLAVGSVADAAAASAAAAQHYGGLGQPVLAAAEPDSPAEEALVALGWEPLDTGASSMLVAPVSRAARRSRERGRAHPITTDESAREASARVLGSDGVEVARGRAVLTGSDWVGIEDLLVAPAARRQGMAHAIVADLLDWAGSQGAMTAWLHVEDNNAAARDLYLALGFTEHHQMRYLALGGTDSLR